MGRFVLLEFEEEETAIKFAASLDDTRQVGVYTETDVGKIVFSKTAGKGKSNGWKEYGPVDVVDVYMGEGDSVERDSVSS